MENKNQTSKSLYIWPIYQQKKNTIVNNIRFTITDKELSINEKLGFLQQQESILCCDAAAEKIIGLQGWDGSAITFIDDNKGNAAYYFYYDLRLEKAPKIIEDVYNHCSMYKKLDDFFLLSAICSKVGVDLQFFVKNIEHPSEQNKMDFISQRMNIKLKERELTYFYTSIKTKFFLEQSQEDSFIKQFMVYGIDISQRIKLFQWNKN